MPGAVGSWWTEVEHKQLCRGRLIEAFVPHVGLTPMTLEVQGRSTPTAHERALFTLAPLRIKSPPRAPTIPVAALPAVGGEVHAVYRTKKRPALVLSTGGDDLPLEVTRSLGWQVARTVIVAPYYGVEQSGKRGGWPLEFVRRISRAEYPQYAYDMLPIQGSKESILRLDHLQPIGRHHESVDLTTFVLSSEALLVIDEWLVWLVTGTLREDGILTMLRDGLHEQPPPPQAK